MEQNHILLLHGDQLKNSADLAKLSQEWAEQPFEPTWVLCTAFADTAQQLSALTRAFFDEKENVNDLLDQVRNLHIQWASELFSGINNPVFDTLSNLLVEIEWILEDGPVDAYDYTWDQISAVGPLLSSTLLSAYLTELGLTNHWVDARSLIWTDNHHQHAQIDIEKSKDQIKSSLSSISDPSWIITQAGIGTTSENFSTTLGQDGALKSAQFIGEALGIHEVITTPLSEPA